MPEITNPQYAAVVQPVGSSPPNPNCPICGQLALTLNQEGYIEGSPCSHLVFIYIGEIGGFEYISDDFQESLTALAIEENKEKYSQGIESVDFKSILEEAGYRNELLALEINYEAKTLGDRFQERSIFAYDYSKLAAES